MPDHIISNDSGDGEPFAGPQQTEQNTAVSEPQSQEPTTQTAYAQGVWPKDHCSD